jgi:gluconokinase
MTNKVIIIMGVSGSGKTTIGKMLAEKTGYEFYDADSFHPPQNIDRMKAGIPLTDEDRWPWLDSMNHFAKEKIKTGNVILTCSALKEMYRLRLCNGIEKYCQWVFLKGSYEIVLKRMQDRKEHYMPVSLLQSQLDALEEPADAITADITHSKEGIVKYIISKIK